MVSNSDDRYFLLSGAMSLGIFFGTVILFASVLLHHDSIKSFALNKADYISVSIAMPLQKKSSKPAEKPALVPQTKPAASEPPAAAVPQVTEDVSTLFDNVWTQDVTAKKSVKKKPIDTKRLSAIEKRIKTTKSTKSTEATEKIKSLELARPSVEVVGSSASAAAEVNEYYAKIQAIIYDHFYPPANSEGSSAKVYLSIDAAGRVVSNRILVNSGNAFFDEEVEALMRRIGGIAFPKPPKGEALEIQIILTAEE